MSATPTTFDELSTAIEDAFPRLPRTLQQIAQCTLEKPDAVALGTVATVADAAGVQPSALIRFANAMGFGGFSEMQQLFKLRLLERSGSYRDRIQAMQATRGTQAAASVLEQFVMSGVSDLEALPGRISTEALERTADLIARADRVHVLAQRRAFPVAAYLAYALSQLELKVHLLDGVGGMLPDTARQISPGDVLIASSFKSYSSEVIQTAARASERGTQVVAITDYALSPLKPFATICLEIGPGADESFRSLVSPMCLAQAIVVNTGQRLTSLNRSTPPTAHPASGISRRTTRKPRS